MIPVTQTILHSEDRIGNCLQACVASIFELPIDDVPHFVELEDTWFMAMNEWCLSRFQCEPVMIEAKSHPFQVFLGSCIYIASGVSPRASEKEPDLLHSCVYKDDELIHDPHPDQTGIMDETDFILFVPIDILTRSKHF